MSLVYVLVVQDNKAEIYIQIQKHIYKYNAFIFAR
jgi:hypothetical protein